jgi:TolB-like protein/DNA-binding winged helix-turn-helix (wHTH) protein
VTNEAPSNGWIVFDQVAIDLAGRRLFVNGQVVLLEPKAFAVLSLLAHQPGQALTRDQILDAVWGHRHVTPSVLNRVMTLIRQALKEDGQEHQYLHTLYGVGYRLDAAVRFLAARPNMQHPDFESLEQRTEATESAALEPAQISAVRAPDNHESRAPRRSRLIGWLAVSVTFLMAALAWGLHEDAADVKTVPAIVSPTLVVVPLHAVGDDQNESIFAEGLSEELITQLAHIEGLRLISSTSAMRAGKEGLDPAQLAQRLHVTHALEGSLRQSGDRLRIDLRLIAVPSGRTLWAQGYDRKFADVFGVQQEIAQAVASALTLHIGLEDQPREAVDPQVFREYLRLRSLEHNATDWANDTRQAIPAMRALVARAPDYAAAHGLLALTLASGHLVPNAESEALEEANRALELDPDSLDGHAALAQRACQRTEWTECMNQLRIVHALSPADSLTHLMHGIFLAELGYREQALLHFETANAADPLNYWTNFMCGQTLDALGRHDDAKRYFDLLPGLEKKLGGLTLVARWRNAIWRKDFAGAGEFATQMPEDRRAAYAAVTAAMLDARRWPAADTAIALLERETGYTSFLRLQEPQLNIPAVVSLLEADVRGWHIDAMLMWAPEFAPLRHAPAFGDLLLRMHMPQYWAENGWPPQCTAEGRGVRCE